MCELVEKSFLERDKTNFYKVELYCVKVRDR